MKIQPYLSFEGQCEKAIAFYRSAVGAEVTFMMRMKESPEPQSSGCGGDAQAAPADIGEKIMHAALDIGGNVVMVTDGMMKEPAGFKGISLSISVGSQAEAEKAFAGLSQGGQVVMPLGKTFWSPCFGMLVDPFGVHWMVSAEQA